MDEITLSSTEFRALSSETRTGIIKLLSERNHTLSELSKKIALAAPTVKQHLGVLEQAGIIQCIDEGRKWKYYCLTKKGKIIFQPETPGNIFIVLGLTILGMAVVLYTLLGRLAMPLAAAAPAEESVLVAGALNEMAAEAVADKAVPGAVETAQAATQTMDIVPLAVIAVIFAALTVIFLLKVFRRK